MGKLSAKQEMFCREYLVDLNATQAAIRAGYSERSARANGPRLLTNADVAARVKELQEERMQQLGLDAYWVLKRLKDISDRAMQAEPIVEWDHLNHEYKETGEYQFDGASANRSTELIGKHLGMFKENVTLNGNLNIQFVDDIDDDG